MKPIAAVAAMLVLLAGCAGAPPRDRQWVGRTRTDLVAALGQPSSTTGDGRNGTVLIYDRHLTVVTPRRVVTDTRAEQPSQMGIPPAYYTEKKLFYADPQGVIYDMRTLEQVR